MWEVLRDWPLIREEDPELCRRDRGAQGHTPGPVWCSFLKEGRPFCQALPEDMEWSLVPQHHLYHVSFGLTLKLGFPAVQQLLLES